MNYQSLFFQNSVQNISSGNAQALQYQVAQVEDVIFVKIETDAQLKLILLDDAADREKKTISYHILLEKNAQLNFLIGIIHAQDLDLKIYLYLQGDGSQANVSGIYALSQHQKLKIETVQNHYGVNTKSSVTLHGMLQDQASVDVQGLIFIDQKACKTDASQENKNIVLSQQAHVVSVPSIEVLNHDVQCCHGTAVGQFQQQHRWYLQSRGFDDKASHQMLVQSFFGDVVQKFEKGSEFMEMLCKKMV